MRADEPTTHFVIVITMARSRAKKPKAKAAKAKAKAKPVKAKAAKAKAAKAKRATAKVVKAKPAKAKIATAKRATATPAQVTTAKAKAKAAQETPAKARASKASATSSASSAKAASNALPATVMSSTHAPTAEPWRDQLRAAVEATGPDFAAHLRGLGATGWEHADAPELAGLEQWGTELATRDRMAGIGALVRAAQYGYPLAVAAGGVGLDHMGFHASEGSMDGAPVETQIALAAAWLDAPDAEHLAAVAAGNDPSRQLQIWDDDLRPPDDRAHWWYSDVGQCCGHAITRQGGDPAGDSYYEWPPEACVGRGLVIAVRGIRDPGANLAAILANVRAALVA